MTTLRNINEGVFISQRLCQLFDSDPKYTNCTLLHLQPLTSNHLSYKISSNRCDSSHSLTMLPKFPQINLKLSVPITSFKTGSYFYPSTLNLLTLSTYLQLLFISVNTLLHSQMHFLNILKSLN